MNTYKNNFFENKYTDDQYKGQGRVLPTRSIVLVKFVYQYTYINIHIHTHTRMYIHTYTYIHAYIHIHTHACSIYIVYLFVFFLFCFVAWRGFGLFLTAFLGFDRLLEEEALLCLLFLPTLCHNDSSFPSSIDSSLLLVSGGARVTVSFCVAPAVGGLLVFSPIAASFLFCFVWRIFSCKCAFVVLTRLVGLWCILLICAFFCVYVCIVVETSVALARLMSILPAFMAVWAFCRGM